VNLYRWVIFLLVWVYTIATGIDFAVETSLVFSPKGLECLKAQGCPYWHINGIATTSFVLSIICCLLIWVLCCLLVTPQCHNNTCGLFCGTNCCRVVRSLIWVLWFVTAVVGFASFFIINDNFTDTQEGYVNRVLYFASDIIWELRNYGLILTISVINSFDLPDNVAGLGGNFDNVPLHLMTKTVLVALCISIILDLGSFITFLIEVFIFNGASNVVWNLALSITLILLFINIIWRLLLVQASIIRIGNHRKDYFHVISNDSAFQVTFNVGPLGAAGDKFEWAYNKD